MQIVEINDGVSRWLVAGVKLAKHLEPTDDWARFDADTADIEALPVLEDVTATHQLTWRPDARIWELTDVSGVPCRLHEINTTVRFTRIG